ncbi:MAG: PorT family protein [Cyclobacteriaceae bacterium]|nr:PorT family protein [Cyclobacteriaceae bacterium]
MKKLSGVLTIMLFTFTGYAQVENLEFGIRAGLNISHLIMKDSYHKMPTTARANAMMGVFARKAFSEQISGQVELLYAGISGGIKGNEYSAPGDLRHNLHYVLLPLLARYNINDKISLEAGPQFGYLLSAKRIWEPKDTPLPGTAMNLTATTSNSSIASSTEDASRFYKNLDVAIVVGASYQITSPLSGFIRYQHGLSNLSTYGEDGYIDRNIALSFGLTYLLNK